MYTYSCVIIRWIDGDTVELDVNLGFYATLKITARVYGINSPEMRSSNIGTRILAATALDYATKLAPEKSVVLVNSHKEKDLYEKYGRWLATITLADGRDFAAMMIASGHAVKYNG